MQTTSSKAKKVLTKLIETNPFFKELFEKSSGFRIRGNTIIFFNVYFYNEALLRNRLSCVKDVKIEDSKNIKIFLA